MALNPTLRLPDTGPSDEPQGVGEGYDIADIRRSAADQLAQSGVAPRTGAPGAPNNDSFLKRLEGALPQAPQPQEGMLHGVGTAIGAGAAELGHQITGAAAWAGNQIAPNSAVTKGLNWANQTAGQSAEDWQQSMTPQDRELMAREWTTLDPAKSIWQGSPHDFVHTLTL